MFHDNRKPSSSEETVQAKVYGGSLGGRSETKGGRINVKLGEMLSYFE